MTPLSFNDGLLLAHAATTLFMVGVIWFVQMVHYPLFQRVGQAGFAEYERQHTRKTGYVLAVPMLVELTTAVALTWRLGGALSWSGLVLLMGIWLSTWLWQVPAHHRLEHGFDAATHRRLVRTNWLRTIGWSARGILALALLVVPRS